MFGLSPSFRRKPIRLITEWSLGKLRNVFGPPDEQRGDLSGGHPVLQVVGESALLSEGSPSFVPV
jgi:hypothetical protein